MKRRQFLAAAGAGALTVTLAGCGLVPVIPKRPTSTAGDALGWILHENGRYTLWLPSAEMGQQISTALQGLAATELGVPPAQVHLQLPGTCAIARVRATVGSASVQDFALPLARACATLREALAQGQTSGTLAARDIAPSALRSLQPRTGVAKETAVAPGQLHALVTGQPLFAGDTRLPGLLHGRVLRAPVSAEITSRPQAWNEAAARADPACVAVVQDPRLAQMGSLGLGIVARTPSALDRIEAALAVQWQVEDGSAFEQAAIDARIDIDTQLRRGPLQHRLRKDDLPADTAWTLDLRMDIPLAAHAPIEPRSATAQWLADADQEGIALKAWAGTQDLFYMRDVLARQFNLNAERIEVQACRIGGGFGGRTLCTVELEAAVLAQAVGAPVKVQWSRAQEFAQGFQRPPSSHRVRARVHGGRITHWWHALASSHILFTPAAMPLWMQTLADLAGDSGVARGAQMPYDVPQQRIEFTAQRLPVHTGPWRGLGAGPNTLVVESAMD
ncbi:MAG: molybdopterin-dependent oxidoreductase, partial [Acidovorax sp.]|nr:molybdopterin-dependent oxidoreductase [Acidovorax sp.]